MFKFVKHWLMSVGIVAAMSAGAETFPDNSTVVFFGDSITRSGRYIEFITDFYRTRYPGRHVRFISAGHGGDTSSGARSRISYDVAAYNPAYVSLMFGMNESGGSIVGNLTNLANDLKSQIPGVTLLYLTPTIYDEWATMTGNPTTGGWWNNNDHREANLAARAAEVKQVAAADNNALCVDTHTPMLEFTQAHQATDPYFSLTVYDRVHPNALGHAVMAFAFLQAQGVDSVVSDVEINAAELTVLKQEKAMVSALRRKGNTVAFSLLASSLPFPVAPEALPYVEELGLTDALNRETLKVVNLASGDWVLKIDGERIGTYSAADFAAGVQLGFNARTPQYRQAQRVFAADLELYHREEAIRNLHDMYEDMKGSISKYESIEAWYAAGTPGATAYDYYKHGAPELVRYWSRREEKMAELDALQQQVYPLAQPVAHTYEIVPAAEAGEEVIEPPPTEIHDRPESGGGSEEPEMVFNDGYVAASTENLTVSIVGNYRVYQFLSGAGEAQLALCNPAKSCRYLVVGGGGAGGWTIGGGGGGGGVLEGKLGSLAIGTAMTLQAGAGGVSPTGSERKPGNAGSPSKLKIGEKPEIVALGGGGGAIRGEPPPTGEFSSGGGAAGSNVRGNTTGAGTGGAGTEGQGYAGGNALESNIEDDPAGGGGGAGGKGGDGVTGKSGDGGPGIASDITGVSVIYGSGGGGGGKSGVIPGAGGTNAGAGGSTGVGSSAPDGFGGGGGGGGYSGEKSGGNGGGGTVIIALEFDAGAAILYEDSFATCSSADIQHRKIGDSEIYIFSSRVDNLPSVFKLKRAVKNFRYLVVGGGGAGGWTIGAGGGGGGVLEGSLDSLAKGTEMNIVVGHGGNAARLGEVHNTTTSRIDGGDGESSSLTIGEAAPIIALGGGGGGCRPNTPHEIGHGLPDYLVASGGGGAGTDLDGFTTAGGVATVGQGCNGGAAHYESPGGGGGATTPGTDGTYRGAAGNGGEGKICDITGEEKVYGSGGGGGAGNSCKTPGAGGTNAGAGGTALGTDGKDGVDGFGGGGGGGGFSTRNERRGGYGGDGTVILAFEPEAGGGEDPEEPIAVAYTDDFLEASASPAVKEVGGRRVYVFGATSGEAQVRLKRSARDCRYLVVGGGGAGGWTIGGGGGGGGAVEGSLGKVRSGKTLKLAVGKGGKGSRTSDNATNGWNSGLDGEPSSLSLGDVEVIRCLGGGGGCGRWSLAHGQPYENVATGGGGAYYNTGGSGLVGCGYYGGNAVHESPGGGGGVTGPGQAGVWDHAAGDGGPGYLSTITGEARVYGAGGGGGAGNTCTAPGARGSVQAGAGGAAGAPGEAAVDGYGCGGGGGGYANGVGKEGGFGGDGTVVLSFDFSRKPGLVIVFKGLNN